ncbi:MAG: biopolymer transporter ExbD [Burkholderiaceae bacterium]|nr:biopolymer transporter ExbD [Burkholderiaceae bacterium]
MNFQSKRTEDDLDINLIPLIDVLLVILIFLAATTSFTRFNQIKLNLPQASADQIDQQAMNIAISQEGLYALDDNLLNANNSQDIAQALRQASAGRQDASLIINADARTAHESVIRVMEAARLAGITRVSFATQDLH